MEGHTLAREHHIREHVAMVPDDEHSIDSELHYTVLLYLHSLVLKHLKDWHVKRLKARDSRDTTSAPRERRREQERDQPRTLGSVLFRLFVPLVLWPALFFDTSRAALPADEPSRRSADGAVL